MQCICQYLNHSGVILRLLSCKGKTVNRRRSNLAGEVNQLLHGNFHPTEVGCENPKIEHFMQFLIVQFY